jgi:hypothetical protein
VVTDELVAAGGLIGASDSELTQAQAGLSGAEDACQGTPAAFAMIDLATSAVGAVSSAHDAVSAMASALREAAYAYSQADATAASTLRVSGG